MLNRLFKRRPAIQTGRDLYAATALQARRPVFYTEGGVPDTAEGRFELYALHLVLVLNRLKQQGPEAAEVAQGAFDAFVSSLDHALREIGVGDLSVGRKMRKLGEAFYGRVKHYDEALSAWPDPEPLRALIARTVLADADADHAPALADYAGRTRDALAATPLAEVMAARLPWPEFLP